MYKISVFDLIQYIYPFKFINGLFESRIVVNCKTNTKKTLTNRQLLNEKSTYTNHSCFVITDNVKLYQINFWKLITYRNPF